MNLYEVRGDLHEFHRPFRWSLHKDGEMVGKYQTDVEAYAHMNDLKNKPGLYCKICCSRLQVKGVCRVFCPKKNCGE